MPWTLLAALVLAPLFIYLIARYLGHDLHFTLKRTTHTTTPDPKSLSFHFINVLYTHGPTNALCTLPTLTLTIHLPTSSSPKWCTLSCHDYEYKDLNHHVTIGTVSITCWFFPTFFGRTTGAWISTMMDDYRVLVYTSTRTPKWLDVTRTNLISTFMKGETLRCDHFKSDVVFGGALAPMEEPEQDKWSRRARRVERKARRVIQHIKSFSRDLQRDHVEVQETLSPTSPTSSPSPSPPSSSLSPPSSGLSSQSISRSPSPVPVPHHNADDIRATLSARNWVLFSFHNRIYSIGALDIQIRKNWAQYEGNNGLPRFDLEGEGKLVFIAQDSKWTKVPAPEDLDRDPVLDSERTEHWIWTLLITLLESPITLISILLNPPSIVDVEVPRIDLTYSHFRMRDTDVDVQVGTFMRMQYVKFKEECNIGGNGRSPGARDRESEFWEELAWAGCVKGLAKLLKPSRS
ncbi:hypothetical protein AX16_001587 [Volvariella volvacea WC 439]|nr:hypothetical protein AX16_001587 [Volvariella volvacea WC 439]